MSFLLLSHLSFSLIIFHTSLIFCPCLSPIIPVISLWRPLQDLLGSLNIPLDPSSILQHSRHPVLLHPPLIHPQHSLTVRQTLPCGWPGFVQIRGRGGTSVTKGLSSLRQTVRSESMIHFMDCGRRSWSCLLKQLAT
jgi:hypothetical protein